ncbi:PGF-CTERM sorting domain-containing protein [Natronomonas gomsonensis]|uniref:PGF-CTERM sorting domain-containing protein n=1 Tax=Natronomonas gomsonensis TaxID=1046043 RepID=UPI0015BCCEAE|nr:PGF-CTERM sorting domain-containing protein [Natronomonas gomsonensis]
MGPANRQRIATLLSIALITSMVAGVTLLAAAAGPAAAQDSVTRDEAPDKTDAANFTVNLPFATDHYPGDQNEENGSIEYYAVGSEAFNEVGAEEGVWFNYIIIDAQWIDYSACDIPNTKAFGIDRDSSLSGTQFDEDLVQKQRNTNFLDDGIEIKFYDFSDFSGDPPYMAPEDQVVAAQGAGSQDGTCLTMTSEPGWYRLQAFLNGTVADNGPDEEPSEDAEEKGLRLQSNYLYVCECDNEEEAREQLGPPPNEDPDPTPTPTESSDSTPTPTESSDSTPTPTEAPDNTATPEPTEPPESTPEPTDPPDDTPQPTDPPEETTAPTATQSNNGGGGGNDGGGGNTGMTPTSGEGPGFGPAVAILALLGSALLANRRR